ncbi:hypothetical protein [Empedobacter tilapiae]|nr:hypothetical protein [Empedobacter tilapiae]
MIKIATENDIPELKRMMIKLLQHHQEFSLSEKYKPDFEKYIK